MRFLISWLLALAKASTDDSEVLVLTSANFDQAIADHKYLLVEFCKFFYNFIFRENLYFNHISILVIPSLTDFYFVDFGKSLKLKT